MFPVNITFQGASLTFPGCTSFTTTLAGTTLEYAPHPTDEVIETPEVWGPHVQTDGNGRVTAVKTDLQVRVQKMPVIDAPAADADVAEEAPADGQPSTPDAPLG